MTDESGASEDQRSHPRYEFPMEVVARFEQQRQRYPVEPGRPVKFIATDLSRGGMAVQTPWPLVEEEILQLQVTIRNKSKTEVVDRRGRVVNVRQAKKGVWIAGLRFIGEDDEEAAA